MIDRDSRKARREPARKRHCRIGERSRGGEPIGGRNRQADQPRDRVRCKADAAQYRQNERERRDCFRQPLGWSAAHRRPDRERGQIEHEVRRRCADDAAKALHEDVGKQLFPRECTPQSEDERHRSVEMRAGNRRENRDQHDENGAGRNGIAQ